MTQNVMLLDNPEFGQFRMLMIDGKEYFVGKDIANILGYSNASKALSDHVDEEDKLNNETLSSLGQRGGWLINESGLYSLIFSSKLPTAKKFKRWVTNEVLPSIRKHGMYIPNTTLNQIMNSPDRIIELVTRLKEERDLRVQLEKEMEQMNRTLETKYDNLNLTVSGVIQILIKR